MMRLFDKCSSYIAFFGSCEILEKKENMFFILMFVFTANSKFRFSGHPSESLCWFILIATYCWCVQQCNPVTLLFTNVPGSYYDAISMCSYLNSCRT